MGKVSWKPKLVVEYDYTMGGVDRADNKLFHNKRRGKKSGRAKINLDFRMELVENIIKRYHTEDM
ncbi:hypothetical protein J437_LFUL002877 [Ladona fulva]|uniref:Uncharacterized protein n=1 Tax=Ladona fulva TaxID=123851 RepID=A0A8K0KP58_LADFU|nr:hypothetical protein J437_LFUL002877 [Ladona fulva]